MAQLENILKIGKKIGIDSKYLEQYGNYKAKVSPELYESVKNNPDGKLVLVTAITPTKAGEGKTTTCICIHDGLAKLNKKSMLCLREPSMGPVFGLKGGATGGGKATIEPKDDINLHFTGDMHALTSSINLIAAFIDNHIYQGNELNIDKDRILWKRALDMNDRELREIEIGLGSKINGIKRTGSFEITVASELMAIMCISKDRDDFKNRVDNILVAYTYDDKPVYLKDLKITNAVMALMEDALKPNLVQTSENNPVFVHGGPFANIAHGCSSLIATKLALKLAPIVLTEAGFAADLGAEKFLDIKCRVGGLNPSAVVLVATIRALKMHGGESFENLSKENLPALEEGFKNLEQHYLNLRKYGLPVIIAINKFATDTKAEIDLLANWCNKRGYKYSLCTGVLDGGDGSVDLASKLLECLDTQKPNFKPLYDLNLSIKEKIEKIAKEIYRARSVIYLPKAEEDIKAIEKLGKSNYVVCMAKTQNSFSDNPKLLNTPRDFDVTVKEVKLSNGAQFIVALCGPILTMPGMPKEPAALNF